MAKKKHDNSDLQLLPSTSFHADRSVSRGWTGMVTTLGRVPGRNGDDDSIYGAGYNFVGTPDFCGGQTIGCVGLHYYVMPPRSQVAAYELAQALPVIQPPPARIKCPDHVAVGLFVPLLWSLFHHMIARHMGRGGPGMIMCWDKARGRTYARTLWGAKFWEGQDLLHRSDSYNCSHYRRLTAVRPLKPYQNQNSSNLVGGIGIRSAQSDKTMPNNPDNDYMAFDERSPEVKARAQPELRHLLDRPTPQGYLTQMVAPVRISQPFYPQ